MSPRLSHLNQYLNDDVQEIGHSSAPPLEIRQSENLLDLGNWLSSDDESFNISINPTPKKRTVLPGKQPLQSPYSELKKSLLSSPVATQIFGSEYEPFSAQNGLEITPSRLNNIESKKPAKSVTKKRKITVLNMTSDPIESSSPMKSPPPAKKSKAAKLKNTDINDRSGKAWKEANKMTRRKQEILSEMVVEISLCLQNKIQTDYFKNIFLLPKVRNSYLELPLISWKRRVTAKYNKEEDVFVPCELTEISERVLLLLYEPSDLVEKLQKGLISVDIERAKKRANAEDPLKEYFVFLMVPCFSEYLRKLQTLENRQYRARALQQLNQTQLSRKKNEDVPISSAEALRLLIDSEVRMGINIFTTKTVEESIDWLHSFTYTIGSSIYDKFERNPEFANIGTVRLGSTPKGTYLEMIKKFNLMTEPKAENLYQYYASPLSLYKRFVEHGDLGSVNGRNIIPPSVSKMMKKVLTCQDPNAVITD